MEKLKDFLYNKNDILIAVFIVIIAAIVIYFRVHAIMDYPSKLIEESLEGSARLMDVFRQFPGITA